MNRVAKTLVLGAVATLSCALRPAIQRQQEMLNPTVMVTMERQMGSGTVLHSADDGTFVLTNYHVIDEALDASHLSRQIAVIFWLMGPQGDTIYRSKQEADLVASDQAKDIALLQIRDRSDRTPSVAILSPKDERLLVGKDCYVTVAKMGHRVIKTQGLLYDIE